MESSGLNRVRGESRSRPNSPASVDGEQASHAPSIHEQGQATGVAVDILQQIAQHCKEQHNQSKLSLSGQ